MWNLNNTLLNDHWIKKEIKREIRKYLELNDFKTGNRHDQTFFFRILSGRLRKLPTSEATFQRGDMETRNYNTTGFTNSNARMNFKQHQWNGEERINKGILKY